MRRWQAASQRFGRFFSPPPLVATRRAPHIRDGINVQWVMNGVMVALLPCLAMALYNTGLQANSAMQQLGIVAVPGWRGRVLSALHMGYDPANLWDVVGHGLLYFLPIYAVAVTVGGLWQRLFATLRRRPITAGFRVTALLFTLSLPPTAPLWQVALGISFGVVIAKEVFGGTGKNFLNPAMTGLAFLYLAYPNEMTGEAIWTAVDGFSGATSLRLAAVGGVAAITQTGMTWSQSFVGQMQGALGETSTLACLLGAVFLLYTRLASWRIMAGGVMGMVVTASFFNLIGSDVNPLFAMPWYWHLTLGSFAFGMVFVATDPVSAAMTDRGRWLYGLLIGFMIVLIRTVNPAHAEGVMFAILLGNIFAPVMDYAVMWANIRRRARRHATH